MGTQAEENGIGTGSFKIQENELSHNDKMRNDGDKSNHKQHLEEKSHDIEHHEGMKHKGMRHEGHEPSAEKITSIIILTCLRTLEADLSLLLY